MNPPETPAAEPQHWWQGLTPYQWLVLFVAWLGWTFDVMDALFWTFVKIPASAELLHLPASDPDVKTWAGAIQAALLVGWSAGGIVFGILADKIGRTRTMVITILVYSVFTGLSYFSHNIWELTAYRFLTGLGVGGEWASGASLLAEVFPRRSRTWAACALQSAASVGIILANSISGWLTTHGYSWRHAFLVGIAPALLTVLVRLGLKEPERWQKATHAHAANEIGSIPELFSDRFRRRTIVGMFLALAGVFGIWGANYWAPELLMQVAREHKTYILNLQTLAQMIGFLFCAPLAVYVGRRPAFAFYFLGSLIATPLAFHATTNYATAIWLIPLMGFFTGGMFSGYIIYFPELYPTRLRATGAGFCYNVARVTAAPGPWLMGWLQGYLSLANAATVIALIYLVGLAALPFAEETKGKPLPED